jgi:two-component system OmpR family response regulator
MSRFERPVYPSDSGEKALVASQKVNATISRLRFKLSHIEGGLQPNRNGARKGYLPAATVERVSAD